MRNLAYINVNQVNPSTATRTVEYVLTDGDGGTLTLHSTIDVVGVNDAPSGTDKAISVAEDGSYVFTIADFGFTDVDGNQLLEVVLSTTPTGGTLYLDADGPGGAAPAVLGATSIISAADIAAGHVYFVPTANGNGTAFGNFQFQVRDDGGTAGGGQDIDLSANIITINVTPVNDAPSGTDATRTILEDGTFTFAAADFGYGDPADGNQLLAVKITTLPANGTLTLNGVAVAAGQSVAVADINAGRLHYLARRQCERHRLCQLHLPGAGRWRHRQWRRGYRPERQQLHLRRHAGERRAVGH